MTAANLDRTTRLALVLRDATFLDRQHWGQFARKRGLREEVSAWEILNSNVSLQSISDLLNMPILPRKGPSALANAIGEPVTIHSGEILAILRKNQPDVAKLCHAFLSASLMDTGALEASLDKADSHALNVYDVLVTDGLVTPEKIAKVVGQPTNDVSIENRNLLAGEILVFNTLITRDDLARANESRAVTLAPMSVTLEQLNVLRQQDLLDALERGFELPTMDVAIYDVSAELVSRFPEDFMRRQVFVPLSVQERQLEIATADPFNLALADTISILTGKRVLLSYSPHTDILSKFDQIFLASDAPAGAPALPTSASRRGLRAAAAAPSVPPPVRKATSASGDGAQRVSDGDSSRAKSEPFVDNLSAVQVVSQILDSAIDARATDIHFEALSESVRVRFRIDGQMHSIMKVPQEMQLAITSRIKVLAQMNVTERRRPQDGHFFLETPTGYYDFRVSSLPCANGEKIVLRVLDSSRVMTGLEDLGFEEDQLEAMNRLLARAYGMILVTGPTGSGKTSTLYSCLRSQMSDGVNIISIEDPVEYMLDGVTQVQVDANIDLTFANGLRSALRQDPDIIMVGEIRDPDTASVAIRAALTGHQVFSTLHTNTAMGAISALGHLNVPRYLVASATAGIISQRLVRRICESCKVVAPAPKAVLTQLGLSENTRKKLYKGEGCAACLNTGFTGRTGLFEVVEIAQDLRRAIAEGSDEQGLAELAAERSKTMLSRGVHKMLLGVTTPAEVLKEVVA